MKLIKRFWQWILSLWRGPAPKKPETPEQTFHTMPNVLPIWEVHKDVIYPKVYGEWLMRTGRYWRNLKNRKHIKKH